MVNQIKTIEERKEELLKEGKEKRQLFRLYPTSEYII